MFRKNKYGIMINEIRQLPQDRYIAALERIQDQIESGSKLVTDDSDEIGNKHTYCSWGLCSGSTEQWPDKEDRLFPRDYPLGILNRTEGQDCPFDKNQERGYGPSGCFYHCRIFQHPTNPPSREEAIRLYQIQLDKVK